MGSLSSEDQGELRDSERQKCAAIVVAAGSGQRFGRPKQYEILTDGERLVDRAVRTAREAATFIVVVLPAGDEWTGAPVDRIAVGGSTRLASVAAGLAAVPAEFSAMLVHDPAHALASARLCRRVVSRLFAPAANEASPGRPDGVVPLLATAEVIKRQRDDGRIETVGREHLGAAQAPMAFRRRALDAAHALRQPPAHLRDDSELVEHVGGIVVAVPGEMTNIHIVDEGSLGMARKLSS